MFLSCVLQRLESLLDCKDIKPVNPKGNQPLIFTGRTDAEAEAPILWSLDEKSHSLETILILRKIEDKRRRWHRTRWLDSISHSIGHNSEQTLEDSEGQRSLECFSPCGHKEADMTYQLNINKNPFCSCLDIPKPDVNCVLHFHLFSML